MKQTKNQWGEHFNSLYINLWNILPIFVAVALFLFCLFIYLVFLALLFFMETKRDQIPVLAETYSL